MTHTMRHELAIKKLVLLGVNTVYIAFCFVRILAMVGKGFYTSMYHDNYSQTFDWEVVLSHQ